MSYQARMLQLLIENAHDFAIVMMNTEGHITLWNVGAYNVLGWQEAEVVGKPAAVFFTPEDQATGVPEQEFRTAREQGRAEDERWHMRKDGSRFWGSGLVEPIHGDDGTLQGYSKIFRDLTERRQAEEALRAERERLQATLDAAEVGTWLVDAVSDRVIGDTILCGFFGLTEEQAASATAETYLSRIHPDDAHAVAVALQHSMTTGEKFDVTYRVPQQDGTVRWLEVRGQAAFDAKGHFIHLYGAGRDVTAHKEVEQAREQAQAQAEYHRSLLDAVLDALPAGLAIADAAGGFVRINAAFERIWGVNPPLVQNVEEYEQYVGYRYDTGKQFASNEWAMARALQGEVCPGDLVEIEKFDGSGRSVIVNSAAPVQNASGEIIGGVVTQTDVTAQVRAEEALRRKQTEIEGLNVRLQRAMQEAHHRIKNNLQVIAALVEMQADELGNGSAVQRIKQHVRSLATIHDLLTRQAKADTNTSTVSTNDVLERLIPMLQATSGDRHIKADVEDVLLPVQKATSLALLVSECVSNAVKHAQGEVEITLTVEGDMARLEVCDDGIGFASDFDPRKAAHTGLELIDSTARWDLRGEVVYENRDQGGGRVVVTFPLDMSGEP